MSHEYKVNDRVRYINEEKHLSNPEFYPAAGTVGTVSIIDEEDALDFAYVQWPEGSTSGDDLWWCSREDVEPVTE